MFQYQSEIDNVHKKYLTLIEKAEESELLYHYTSPSGLIGIIESNKFWFTDSDYLNDETESIYFYNIFSEVTHNGQLNINKNYGFKAYYISMLHTNIAGHKETYMRDFDNRFVASFSIDRDNLNLWNYYTKNPTRVGYNLGIELNKFISNIQLDADEALIHGRIIYNKKKQKEILSNMFKDYENLYKLLKYTYQRNYLFNHLEGNIMNFSIFMKNPSFSSEEEYRVAIIRISENEKQNTEFREDMGIIIPHISKKFNKNCIAEIGISPSSRSKFAEKSLQKYAYEKDLDVKVFSSEIPLRY